jgi:hypothetical protein
MSLDCYSQSIYILGQPSLLLVIGAMLQQQHLFELLLRRMMGLVIG